MIMARCIREMPDVRLRHTAQNHQETCQKNAHLRPPIVVHATRDGGCRFNNVARRSPIWINREATNLSGPMGVVPTHIRGPQKMSKPEYAPPQPFTDLCALAPMLFATVGVLNHNHGLDRAITEG